MRRWITVLIILFMLAPCQMAQNSSTTGAAQGEAAKDKNAEASADSKFVVTCTKNPQAFICDFAKLYGFAAPLEMQVFQQGSTVFGNIGPLEASFRWVGVDAPASRFVPTWLDSMRANDPKFVVTTEREQMVLGLPTTALSYCFTDSQKNYKKSIAFVNPMENKGFVRAITGPATEDCSAGFTEEDLRKANVLLDTTVYSPQLVDIFQKNVWPGITQRLNIDPKEYWVVDREVGVRYRHWPGQNVRRVELEKGIVGLEIDHGRDVVTLAQYPETWDPQELAVHVSVLMTVAQGKILRTTLEKFQSHEIIRQEVVTGRGRSAFRTTVLVTTLINHVVVITRTFNVEDRQVEELNSWVELSDTYGKL